MRTLHLMEFVILYHITIRHTHVNGEKVCCLYIFLSYNTNTCVEHGSWPVYMVEMMDVDSVHFFNKNSIFDTFGISEYILIHLVCNLLGFSI